MRRSGAAVSARRLGKREAMKSRRECVYRYDLDMETLVWTRGPNFPISRLESRLMCPKCGSRRVVVILRCRPSLTHCERASSEPKTLDYREKLLNIKAIGG